MEAPRMISTEDIIRAAVKAGDRSVLRAPRGEKTIWAGLRRMRVRTAGEKMLYLPNGSVVKITTDASGVATQIEETEHLHAIARPHGINLNTIRQKERS
jgi:hypothetical protein